MMHEELTREQAIALAESGWWKNRTAREIVTFQLFTPLLCMDFGDFQQAVEEALGRSVWTHEFAKPENLQTEFLGARKAPTFQEIMEQIPAEKRLFVVLPENNS